MLVKDLIKLLLECDMGEEVEILLSKGKSESIYCVHERTSRGYQNSGVAVVAIEPSIDLDYQQ